MRLIRNTWEVNQIPVSQAKDFVHEHHYSNGTSNTAVACYGLFYQGSPELHGVSWWMPPPLGAAKSVSKNHRGVLSLSRFCLVKDRPENAGSFLISRSIRSLDSRWTMLLTYADQAMNHDGGLYRASNWSYNGETKKNPLWWDPETDSMVSKKKGPRTLSHAEMIDSGYILKGRFKKHRYIYPIQRSGLVIQSRREQEERGLFFTNDGKIFNNK